MIKFYSNTISRWENLRKIFSSPLSIKITHPFFSILTFIFLQIEYIRGFNYTGINHLLLSSYYVYIIAASSQMHSHWFQSTKPMFTMATSLNNNTEPFYSQSNYGHKAVYPFLLKLLSSTFRYVILLVFILRNKN